MEFSQNAQKQTPEDNILSLKISKNDFSDSSLGENLFPNISTKTGSGNKNYLRNIKENDRISLCRKLDFSMEMESNDSKDIKAEERENIKNDNFSIKDESNNSIININNKLSLSSEEQMDLDEELDLRLIKKNSSKSICLNTL